MLATAFVLGVVGGLHCVGMCGPIAFILPTDRTNAYKKIGQIIIYHLGRLLAYTSIGLVFGIIGEHLYLFGFQQQLSVGVGVVMIALVVFPYSKLSSNASKPVFKIVTKLKAVLGVALQNKTGDAFLTIGFLNGFLPCGLVYLAVFGALAASSVMQGILYMFLFGLGTIPLMTISIYLGKFLKTSIRLHIQKLIPVVVVVIGILFILRGMGLGIPYLSPEPVVDIASGNLECY